MYCNCRWDNWMLQRLHWRQSWLLCDDKISVGIRDRRRLRLCWMRQHLTVVLVSCYGNLVTTFYLSRLWRNTGGGKAGCNTETCRKLGNVRIVKFLKTTPNTVNVTKGNLSVTTFLEFLETWKCQRIRLRSGKSRRKGPKSRKCQGICVVRGIWLWKLNKVTYLYFFML